jgi:hypothetical protein
VRAGWHLGIQLDAFATPLADYPASLATDDDRWLRLWGRWQTHRGAACALVACGLDPDTVAALTIGDVADDATTVTVNGTTHQLPSPAARLV